MRIKPNLPWIADYNVTSMVEGVTEIVIEEFNWESDWFVKVTEIRAEDEMGRVLAFVTIRESYISGQKTVCVPEYFRGRLVFRTNLRLEERFLIDVYQRYVNVYLLIIEEGRLN